MVYSKSLLSFATLTTVSLLSLSSVNAATYIFEQSYDDFIQGDILVTGHITLNQVGELTDNDLNNANYSILIFNANTGTSYSFNTSNSTWTASATSPLIQADNSFLTIASVNNEIGSLLLEDDLETSNFWGYFYSCSSDCNNGTSFIQLGLATSSTLPLAVPEHSLSFPAQNSQIPEPSQTLALIVLGCGILISQIKKK